MHKIVQFIFLTLVFNSYSQTKKEIYVDDKKDYVVLLGKDIKYSSRDIQGTEIDTFVKTSNNTFNYTLLISKIFEHNFISGNLLGDSYEEYFLNTCNCSILDKEIILYNNLKTLRYKIKTKNGENTFIGYNDSFIGGEFLYNILFLTFEDDFEEQSKQFSEIMNTLIINGKTTIDGYKDEK